MMRSLTGVVAALVMTTGCSIQPWVMPYEREKLTDSVMSPMSAPLAQTYRQRAYAAREGAHGIGGVELNGANAGDP